MIISLIVAMDEHGGIGKEGSLPWHLAADLKRFKQLTMGHHIVMGRKTYETIGRSLPGREMIIVTRKQDYFPIGCSIAQSLPDAIALVLDQGESELLIIGGGEIFKQAIVLADRIYLTTVHTVVNADVYFPQIKLEEWEITECETIAKNERNDFDSDFKILQSKH